MSEKKESNPSGKYLEGVFPDDPESADGVVTIPIGGKDMAAVDLPESVASQLMTESVGNIQAANRQGRDTFIMASGALQAGIARVHNELDPGESRAVSGLMATPIASPTTQA